MADWSADEADKLRSLVSRYGHAWSSIARTRELPGRSTDAMRNHWDRMESVQQVSSKKYSPVAMGDAEGVMLEPLPVPSFPAPARTVHSGRSWSYVVSRSIREGAVSQRKLSDKQMRLVKNWQLDNACGHGLLLCNLKRAEDTLRRYFLKCGVEPADLAERVFYCAIPLKLRDRLGMVVYPHQPGRTLTKSCAAYNWVGGERAGSGRFATSSEVAAFMGHDARMGSYRMAKRYYGELQLCGLLAESVHSRVADRAARVGIDLLGANPMRVGSLYSGAFDELGAGLMRACHACRAFVAESDGEKQKVLHDSFAPEYLFPSVEEVDERAGEIDALVASPPCLVYSKANRVSTAEDKDAAAATQVGQLRRIIQLYRPRLVIIEQTAGLKTHCGAAYEAYKNLWVGLGYTVRESVVCAHTDCEGSHSRSRLIWVAVRERCASVTDQD